MVIQRIKKLTRRWTESPCLLLIPLRGQEPCQKQVVIGHRGRSEKNMLPAALIVITICLLVWLGFEIRWARRFVSEGIPVDATVSRREWISLGSSGRSLRITVAVQNENETIEYPIGYMSFFGFKHLQIGDRIPVLMHPSFRYVIPTGRMGVISRPFIAGSLFLASVICATAFTLTAISK